MADPRSITVADIKLQPMTVKIGSTNIGVTDGGLSLEIEQQTLEQRCDQYDGPVNTWLLGKAVSISVKVLQLSLANLQLLIWGATTRSTGGSAVGIGGKVPGANDAQTDGFTLNMHPAASDTTSLASDVNAFKVIVDKIGTITYGKEATVSAEVTFKPHIDTSKVAAGNAMLDFGLTAAT